MELSRTHSYRDGGWEGGGLPAFTLLYGAPRSRAGKNREARRGEPVSYTRHGLERGGDMIFQFK